MTTQKKSPYQKARQHLEDYLSEFVYGGIDGAVTTFAVVAGATGARFDSKVLLVLGFANLIADGFSMGVGSYLSTKSEQQLMEKKGESITDEPSPVINGVTTYASFILVGLVPLLVFTADFVFDLGMNNMDAFYLTAFMTALAFVGIGLLKSRVAQAPRVRSIMETLVLGVIAAGLAYVLGDLLEKLITG
ncbi:VIT1/CCC1 transporter family protein [Candidatus Saccharibacteria bacterium]|nr:VIT1/CCC1 transporter family protein [Candidatus Saccharibacteria bacterium]